MRLLLIVLLFTTPAWADITYVIDVSAGSTTGQNVTTTGVDTSGANMIVVGLAEFNDGTNCTLSDSKSNTYSTAHTVQLALFYTLRLFYVASASVGSAHTFTATCDVASSPSIGAIAFAGGHSTPLDQVNGTTGSDTAPTPGSITPTQNDEVVISIEEDLSSSARTHPTGYTETADIATVGGQHFGFAMAYIIQTTATATNPAWGLAGSGEWATAVGSFKEAAAATNTPKCLLLGVC